MSNLHFAFLTGFLLRTPSATSIADLCQVSKSTAATALTSQTFTRVDHLMERASVAASTVYLAFDYTQSHHTGSEMQGLSYTYSSSHQASKLGQRYASVALVHSRELPVPISLTYAVSRELETYQYPYLTPSDQLIRVITAVKVQGIHFKGTLVDAEFGNKQVVGHCVTHNDSLLVRMKSNTRVEYCGEEMTLKSLLSHVPRTCCHSYPKLNWRAKRIAVRYDGHAVDILVIWRNIKGTWSAFFLLSTFPQATSLGELIQAWKARWGIEVIHRFIKQNLSFGNCQYRDIRAHQNWADLAVDAFHLILRMRNECPMLSWKSAQLQAAHRCLERVRTAVLQDLPGLEAA
ncbi:transposase (plasmid) [Deinococcus radiomollis]|uniref:transposase n=2 Tax=Deinococcus radiomollis TaxID=468916 RepID=UPI0038916E5E